MRRSPLALALLLLAACTVRLDPAFDTSQATDVRRDAFFPFPDLRDVRPGPADTAPPEDLSFPDIPGPPRDIFVPPAPDVALPDLTSPDSGPAPDLPTYRYCPWEVASLPRTRVSTVFRDEDFLGAESRTSPIDGACDQTAFPDREQPERVFLVDVPLAARMLVRTRCEGWDCDALVLRDDCLTSNVAACLTTDGDERFALEVLPGAHLIVVERRAPFLPGLFDLQVALNNERGYEDCPVHGDYDLAAIEQEGACVSDERGAFRELRLSGDTRVDAVDQVYLDCGGPGIRRDATGGAPDLIWRFQADEQAEGPRQIDLELLASGDWQAFLAATAAPCGASESVIDCAQSLDGAPARVDALTLFPGDEIYVVVDGMGDLAFEGREAGPFELIVRLAVESCD